MLSKGEAWHLTNPICWNGTFIKKWIDRLIRTRLQVPPPGYQKPTFRQLLDADKKLFEELSDCAGEGVQTTSKGRPLDLVFETCMNKAEVMHYLQPLMSRNNESKE